ncbi:NAD-dependent epimerase/dehydratase family protein [Actinomadura sp. NPDC047616]|uniref:NAD-dependent epimerase/dehydratase family protein n=1 Tax=Actinomadura sp. NPDC047616 TaxID=3155914 RepID=UPI0033F1B3B4
MPPPARPRSPTSASRLRPSGSRTTRHPTGRAARPRGGASAEPISPRRPDAPERSPGAGLSSPPASPARRSAPRPRASPAQVYGHGTGDRDREQVFTEDAPVRPLNPYAAAKLSAEHQTRFLLDAAGVDYTVLRPFSVYGEGQIPKQGALSWAIAQLSMYATIGDPLPLNHGGRQIRDFLHATDAATGIVRALVAPAACRQPSISAPGRSPRSETSPRSSDPTSPAAAS